MKIMVINPNTSASMTDHIRAELSKIKRSDTELDVVCPEKGPLTIESSYDRSLAVPELLKLVKKANDEKYDGVIINGFGDPGLESAREISTILVSGIEETVLHIASMLGAKFSIMTPVKNLMPNKYQEVRHYKLEQWLASVRTTEMKVAEVDADPQRAKNKIMEVAKLAVEEDGAEVIILGCAAMLGYADEISRSLGVTVLDPTSVTLKITEGMIDAGIVHSKKGLFAAPPEKEYK